MKQRRESGGPGGALPEWQLIRISRAFNKGGVDTDLVQAIRLHGRFLIRLSDSLFLAPQRACVKNSYVAGTSLLLTAKGGAAGPCPFLARGRGPSDGGTMWDAPQGFRGCLRPPPIWPETRLRLRDLSTSLYGSGDPMNHARPGRERR